MDKPKMSFGLTLMLLFKNDLSWKYS